MNVLAAVGHHGYLVTALVLFCSACGLPLPSALVLLTAGAAAHGGGLSLGVVLAVGLAAMLCGDFLLFLGGRYSGWWLLAGICRVSVNPETCIFGSAHSFYRRGPRTLLFAKFVPGLSTVSAPLSGSLNMPPTQFLRLDAMGAAMYLTTWTTAGFLLAPWLTRVIGWIEKVGHLTAATLGVVVVLYFSWLAVNYLRDTRFSAIERVTAEAVHESLRAAANHERIVVIADVRSHGYYDPGTQRIKNSIRIEPNRLREEVVALREFMAPECEIYLYCSCAHDATSVRVARALEKENCKTKVIQGGLKAWIKAGGDLEPVPSTDIEHLPRFR